MTCFHKPKLWLIELGTDWMSMLELLDWISSYIACSWKRFIHNTCETWYMRYQSKTTVTMWARRRVGAVKCSVSTASSHASRALNAGSLCNKTMRSYRSLRVFSTSKTGTEEAAVMVPNEISTPMKVLLGYAAVGITAMTVIARWKDGNETEEEEMKVYNFARRAVVKDRRIFDLVGYPKDFEKLSNSTAASDENTRNHLEGIFRIIGETKDKTLIVHYKALKDQEKSTGLYDFERLDVQEEQGEEKRFSALQIFQETEKMDTQKKASSLGNKLFFPVVGGVLLGGISSFFLIKIIRNRPFYIHKLVLDRVNNHDMARTLLGHPIKANRKQYQGTLTSEQANYSIPCQGPKGNGMIYVKASKKESENPTTTSTDKPKDALEESEWKLSTLTLTVQRNDKRPNDKHAKVINLL